jgi:hypothetical protein
LTGAFTEPPSDGVPLGTMVDLRHVHALGAVLTDRRPPTVRVSGAVGEAGCSGTKAADTVRGVAATADTQQTKKPPLLLCSARINGPTMSSFTIISSIARIISFDISAKPWLTDFVPSKISVRPVVNWPEIAKTTRLTLDWFADPQLERC